MIGLQPKRLEFIPRSLGQGKHKKIKRAKPSMAKHSRGENAKWDKRAEARRALIVNMALNNRGAKEHCDTEAQPTTKNVGKTTNQQIFDT